MSDSDQKPSRLDIAQLREAVERAKTRAAKAWEDLWHVEDKPGRRGFVIGTGATVASLVLGKPFAHRPSSLVAKVALVTRFRSYI